MDSSDISARAVAGVSPTAAPSLRGAVGLPWLVADIGGTNARFGWVDDPNAGVRHVQKLAVADHATPAAAARTYLDALRAQLGSATPAPARAALAVATALEGDEVELTNSHWRFSRAQLAEDLSLDALLVLNDFEALALSLPRLGPSQLLWDGALPKARGVLAVVGPGTGLGVGAVVETPSGWIALPGEGGHMTMSAADDFESRLLAEVRRHFAHVSAERLLSGIGLPVLHAAVEHLRGASPSGLASEAIVDRGVSGEDALCRETLEVFCAMLGSFAGNVALTLGSRGGLYIGGGIVPRLGGLFHASKFRQRFEAKGRFSSFLAPIPTPVITDTLAALTGAMVALEQHGA